MNEKRDLAEVVGTRIHEARTVAEMSQERLGEAVSDYLGRPWPKQVVSKIEKGGRLVDAAELVALAAVFDLPISWFLTPATAQVVVLPSGRETLRGDLLEIVHGAPTGEEGTDLVRAREMARSERLALKALAGHLRKVEEALTALRERNDGVIGYMGADWPDETEHRERTERAIRKYLSWEKD
jgi:transcriptional regulator with XRE-family HTH domain